MRAVHSSASAACIVVVLMVIMSCALMTATYADGTMEEICSSMRPKCMDHVCEEVCTRKHQNKWISMTCKNSINPPQCCCTVRKTQKPPSIAAATIPAAAVV